MLPSNPNNGKFQFSVIIITYNSIDMIPGCLASLSQALRSFSSQIFIIDNASSDRTDLWLSENRSHLETRFSCVQIIFNKQNLGYSAGTNQGLKRALGEWILLLNPDVILLPDTVTALLKCFAGDNRIGVVAPQLRFPHGGIQPSCRAFPGKRDVLVDCLGLNRLFASSARLNRWRMAGFDHRQSREVDQPQGAFLLMRQSVLREVGFLDERFPMFFSDVDWCLRVKQLGWRILFCAETYAYHKKGASVYQKRPQMILSSHRSFIRFFQKYDHTFAQKIATGLIYLLLLLVTLPRIILSFMGVRN
jgi:N-acetylglucosaminyl-diphospho-decaprenol L-rhamnosyltransferase